MHKIENGSIRIVRGLRFLYYAAKALCLYYVINRVYEIR